MNRLHGLATALSRIGAVAAGVILVAMTLLVVAEVTVRTLYGGSTFVTEEFVGYGLAAFTFLGIGYSLHHGSLLRLSLVLDQLSRSVRRWVLIVGMVLTLIVSCILTYAFWVSAAQKFRGGTLSAGFSQTPLWIPEAMVLIGLAIFTLQVIVETWALVIGRSAALEVSDPSDIQLDKEVLI